MTVTVRSSKWEDVKHIAQNMRKSDRDELLAVGIHNPGGALIAGMQNSSICLSICSDTLGPVAMFGVIGEMDKPASVWLLGTDAVGKIGKTFMKISRDFIRSFLLVHPLLSNYIDARSVCTIKWLKSLGAEMGKPEPHGTTGLPFCKFTFRRKKDV